ncbi:M23 family metallopeptidase [Streptomyces carpaticus]|uniref:M23 family metallopeptidase n=1 Tax=Streptomyces carpaticus TaxID=285558 RepID=UPI0021FEAE2A|nr:M23 family metallopeptidase [Streptomyces carpaticus]
MASNRYGSHPAYYGPQATDDEPRTEWNPSADTLRPVRGRHRVTRQRGGTIARSRAVLGVGVIAAVGAGGMATAQEGGAGSVPGLDSVRSIPDQIPVLNSFISSGDSGDTAGQAEQTVTAAPFSEAQDAGEALRARILQQAEEQDTTAQAAEIEQALVAAQQDAITAAAELAEEERLAEEQRQREAEEERQRQEEERRLAELRASFTLPLTSYTISSGFGASGTMWSSTHTGTDFAAPTGTPVKNIHTGTVKEAAWAGSYGYRIIVELEDGTELWYCHLSSMNVTAGQSVDTGDTIGRVGSTGNSSGPHLHLEVRPGGDPIDPLTWLRGKGLSV